MPTLYGQKPGEISPGKRVRAGVSDVLDNGKQVIVVFSVLNPAHHAIEILPPQVQLGGKVKKKWTLGEQLPVSDYRLSARRLGPKQRVDGVAVFERPSFKQSNETLFYRSPNPGLSTNRRSLRLGSASVRSEEVPPMYSPDEEHEHERKNEYESGQPVEEIELPPAFLETAEDAGPTREAGTSPTTAIEPESGAATHQGVIEEPKHPRNGCLRSSKTFDGMARERRSRGRAIPCVSHDRASGEPISFGHADETSRRPGGYLSRAASRNSPAPRSTARNF